MWNAHRNPRCWLCIKISGTCKPWDYRATSTTTLPLARRYRHRLAIRSQHWLTNTHRLCTRTRARAITCRRWRLQDSCSHMHNSRTTISPSTPPSPRQPNHILSLFLPLSRRRTRSHIRRRKRSASIRRRCHHRRLWSTSPRPRDHISSLRHGMGWADQYDEPVEY